MRVISAVPSRRRTANLSCLHLADHKLILRKIVFIKFGPNKFQDSDTKNDTIAKM